MNQVTDIHQKALSINLDKGQYGTIAEMKKLVGNLVAFAEKMEYENIEDFANGVAGSIKYKMGEGH